MLTFLLWLTWYLGIRIIATWMSCTPPFHQACTKFCLFWLHLHSEAASVSCKDIANKPMIDCMEIVSPASEVPLNHESNVIILFFKMLARLTQLTWTLCHCVQRSTWCTFKYECCTEWSVLKVSHLKNFSSCFSENYGGGINVISIFRWSEKVIVMYLYLYIKNALKLIRHIFYLAKED